MVLWMAFPSPDVSSKSGMFPERFVRRVLVPQPFEADAKTCSRQSFSSDYQAVEKHRFSAACLPHKDVRPFSMTVSH
jgi:hypothetical protein